MNNEDKTTKFVKKIMKLFHIKVDKKTEKLYLDIINYFFNIFCFR